MKSHLELEVSRIIDIYATVAVNIIVFGEITMYTIHSLVKIVYDRCHLHCIAFSEDKRGTVETV